MYYIEETNCSSINILCFISQHKQKTISKFSRFSHTHTHTHICVFVWVSWFSASVLCHVTKPESQKRKTRREESKITLFISVFTLERLLLEWTVCLEGWAEYQTQSVYFIAVKVWAYDTTILQIHLAPRTPEAEKCMRVSRLFLPTNPTRIESWNSLIALMMEAVRTSETLVYSNETTRRYISEHSNPHTRHRENLKSHIETLNLKRAVFLFQYRLTLSHLERSALFVFVNRKRSNRRTKKIV
jgi:hypothetical protein